MAERVFAEHDAATPQNGANFSLSQAAMHDSGLHVDVTVPSIAGPELSYAADASCDGTTLVLRSVGFNYSHEFANNPACSDQRISRQDASSVVVAFNDILH